MLLCFCIRLLAVSVRCAFAQFVSPDSPSLREYACPRFSLAFRLLVISFTFCYSLLTKLGESVFISLSSITFSPSSIMHHLSFDSNNLEGHVNLSLLTYLPGLRKWFFCLEQIITNIPQCLQNNFYARQKLSLLPIRANKLYFNESDQFCLHCIFRLQS